MPIILVVDDSEVDRRLIGGLLSKDIDWLVEFAGNGAEALDLMRNVAPDVVVTDLLMPEMNGLEFVAAASREFHHVPVVLVTAQGSEELASHALRMGAASYVPKSHLKEGLVETIEQVLCLSYSSRQQERLLQRSTSIRHEFELENDATLFPILIQFVEETMNAMKFCETADRRHVAVALEEALLNAMYHGNLELPKEKLPGVRQELHDRGKSQLLEARRHQTPYCDRGLTMVFQTSNDCAEFVIRDEGSGFDTTTVPAAADARSVAGESGRGLMLIQNFMDSVTLNERGNEIRMTLNRRLSVKPSVTEAKV
jgi:DNA-binding NarL/FixJ family response regulator